MRSVSFENGLLPATETWTRGRSQVPRHISLASRRHRGSVYQRLTHYNAEGVEVCLVSHRPSRKERYKGASYLEQIPGHPILLSSSSTPLPPEHGRLLYSLVDMFSNASTCFVSSYVFYDVTIVALLAVCFAFSSASLFGFWPTFLVAFSSSLTLLSFWKTLSHHYEEGKFFIILVVPSVLTILDMARH